MSLEIPVLLRNRKLFGDSEEIKHELAVAYAEILMVVCEATVHYIKTKRGITHRMGRGKAKLMRIYRGVYQRISQCLWSPDRRLLSPPGADNNRPVVVLLGTFY